MTNKQFTITKKIAKHGSEAVIVIPRVLREQVNHGMLCKVTIDVIAHRNEEGSCSEKSINKVEGDGE